MTGTPSVCPPPAAATGAPLDDLGLALLMLRVITGQSRREPAAAAGKHASEICESERGRNVPELRSILALLTAMGCEPWALEEAARFIRRIRERAHSDPAVRDLLAEVGEIAARIARVALAGAERELVALLAADRPPHEDDLEAPRR